MRRLLLAALLLFSPRTNARDQIFPTLINGRPAPAGEFPASVWVGMCTASLVGERAVFVAAHCVSSGQTIRFTIGANRYTATCSQSADYRGNYTADYAMCATDRAVTGVPFERVNTDANRLRVGDTLLLSGYGCRQPGGGGGIDGTYRIGESKIVRMPSGRSNDIITQGGAALCFGDSGGPAFHINSNGERVVVSTNSRGDIRTTSYLSSTHTPNANRFFQAWFERTGFKICGYHNDATGCRGGGGGTLPSEFSIADSLVNVTGKMTPGNESRLNEVKSAIENALQDLP